MLINHALCTGLVGSCDLTNSERVKCNTGSLVCSGTRKHTAIDFSLPAKDAGCLTHSLYNASSSPGRLKFVYTDSMLIPSTLSKNVFSLRSPGAKVGFLEVKCVPGGNVQPDDMKGQAKLSPSLQVSNRVKMAKPYVR